MGSWCGCRRRSAAGRALLAARSGRRGAPGRAAARDRRRCSPRASAKPPAAPCCCRAAGRRARAAVAAAQARGRSAGGRRAIRLVPDHPRDLSRVPARHLRPAGARRHADAACAAAQHARRHGGVATPSPFAASLLFGYVANYIYDGDAPLAERRAQALSVDQSQLRELIGEAELRDLLDAGGARSGRAGQLQHLPERFHAQIADAVHDLLLRLGDLSRGGDRRARTRRACAEKPSTELLARAAHPARPRRRRGTAHRRRGCRALSRRARHAAAAGPAGIAARAGRRRRWRIWCGATRARTARSPPATCARRFGLRHRGASRPR